MTSPPNEPRSRRPAQAIHTLVAHHTGGRVWRPERRASSAAPDAALLPAHLVCVGAAVLVAHADGDELEGEDHLGPREVELALLPRQTAGLEDVAAGTRGGGGVAGLASHPLGRRAPASFLSSLPSLMDTIWRPPLIHPSHFMMR